MAINKVIYGGKTLIDLTSDTVESNKMLEGTTAHDKSGAVVEGSIPSKETKTYVPTTTDQVIENGQYLSGAQTIKGDVNLVAEKIKGGTTIFGVTGTFTNDATALATEILSGKTAYKSGEKITGTMVNNGAKNGTIANKTTAYTIPQGYHDGGGKVTIDANEQAKIIGENIRQGITILGVEGTMSGTEDAKAQAKEVTPSTKQQVVLPDTTSGYNYLSQVTVLPIPYVETDNDYGTTITIG